MCGDLGDHCSSEKCADVSGFLCDYPVGDDKTCDLPLCQSHAYEVAPDVHYCYGHFTLYLKFCNGSKVNEILENVAPYKSALTDLKLENDILKARIKKLTEPKPATVLPFDPKK